MQRRRTGREGDGISLAHKFAHGLFKCVDVLAREYRYDVRALAKFSHHDEPCEVKISRLLACMFDDDEINAILERELLKAADIIKVDCSRYIDEDREQFIKILKKGGIIES